MLRIVVLVSGGGTNLQAVIDAINSGKITDTEIVGVIASNPSAYAITRCNNAGIPSSVVYRKDFESAEARDKALIDAIDSYSPDLIVLAGFLTILPKTLIDKYPEKIMNIHPSLIPSFCGDGYYGLEVHRRALKRGVKVTGATVHFVDDGTDTGPVIIQKAVYTKPDDTPEVLQRRVMEEAEWQILPAAINAFAHNMIKKDSNGNFYIEE
ncbi:MAG: phosphoribosylglycinamide formyltransferase [Clostridiales bacterium]|nr:phosphoribosylglycinamide formyltransferase [Clostridiales bacterium]